MTRLHKTDLSTPHKVELATAAVALEGNYGSTLSLSDEFGVSRPTVCAIREVTSKVLEDHFERDPNKPGGAWVWVDKAQLQRAIVALRVMSPTGIRPIEDILGIIYPGVSIPAYGTIQNILIDAEEKAAQFNGSVDLSGLKEGALDEMFSQGDPVFAGVDLETGFLFLLSLEASRSGDDWEKELIKGKNQGLELEIVVKDAARGIADGVNRVFPDAEQRDDCFHAHYEMGKRRLILERRAYGAINKELEAQDKLEKAQQSGRDSLKAQDKSEKAQQGRRDSLKELEASLHAARQWCLHTMEVHDIFEQSMREVQDAMEFVDLQTGQIRTALEMRTTIEAAAGKMQAMNDESCKKVGTYIFNRAPGLVLYMNEIAKQFNMLAVQNGVQAVQLAAVVWRLVDDLRKGRRSWSRLHDEKHLIGAYHQFLQVAGKHADNIFAAVDAILAKRFRASSAIEGFNAALRPHLYVHKGGSQGFLDLFKAYFNLRERRWGPRKGTSAYESLTGTQVDDWLSLLGFPPSKALH